MRAPSAFNLALGSVVKRRREVARVTRQELAAHLDVDVSVVSRIESGHVPVRAESLQQVAALFSCSSSELMDEATKATAPKRRRRSA